MAAVNPIRITNIVSVACGSDNYVGIRSATIAVNKGTVKPIVNEGMKYATGAENVGTPEFPVTTSFELESAAISNILLALSSHTLVITGKAAGSAANQVFTIVNHQFTTTNQALPIQDFSRLTVQGVAFSADGSALPLAVTAAA